MVDALQTIQEIEAMLARGASGAAEARLRQEIPLAEGGQAFLLEIALGNVILGTPRKEEALRHFMRIVQDHPREPLGYANLCGAYLLNGMEDGAGAWVTLGLQLFPGNPDLEAVRAVLARPAPGPDAPGAQAEPRTNRVGILSGYYPGTRLNSQVNHKAYADAHGYNYIFNASAEKDPRPFYRKFETIARYLHLFEWVFWIDDDAYFTNFEASMDPFIQQAGEADLLICKSPSTKKLFTKISSGQFLLRNSARAHRFLAALMETEMERIRQFWREDLGMFTSGDQDAIVYLSETDPRFGASFMKILDHNEFNNRDFEFKERCNEHFLVHFTGPSPEKNNYKNAFCERMNINPYLVPEPILENYQV